MIKCIEKYNCLEYIQNTVIIKHAVIVVMLL